ncbi:MAG: MHYT domain-containing protein [Rhodospirillales bacterium]
MWSSIFDPSQFFALYVDPSVVLPATYNLWLVLLSFFVATLAGFAFIHLLHRIAEHENSKARYFWMTGGALIMGLGIWAMHFVGMLAYRLPIPVGYDPAITFLSALPAVLASAWNLQIVAHANVTRARLVLGGVVLGAGIGLMHYTGMAAVEFDAYIRYDFWLFALSLVVAISLAMCALWVAFRASRRNMLRTITNEAFSALLIGCAVAGMHYTAMGSTICFSRTGSSSLLQNLDSDVLAGATAIVASLILIAGIAAVVFDRRLASEVFHRMEASQRAHQTAQRLQLILDNVADAVITLDTNGTIETCNPAAVRIFGYPVNELIGLNISHLLSNLRTNSERAQMLQYFSDPSSRSPDGNGFEVIGRRKDGSNLYLEAALTEGMQNERSVIVAALRDITERNVVAAALARAKETAEKASQAKSEFISHMSHELRTPLNAVIGMADLLLEMEQMRQDPKLIIDYLGDIRTSGRHLLSLVNEILDVSMIEAGGRALEPETFDAVIEVENLIRSLQSTNDRANLNLSVLASESPVLITADKQSFRQIMLNLTTNSISHGGEGVNVEIRIDSDLVNGFAKVLITDNGPGIPEDMLSAVGQPFLKAKAAYQYSETQGAVKGAGLGLYIVNRLMVLNGGKLELISEPGSGTTATTYWPRNVNAA